MPIIADLNSWSSAAGDRRGVGADHLRRPWNTDGAHVVQVHGDVETGLTAERRQHVGLLALMIAARTAGVSGSMYVRSAKSGSVMIVAGFELARITR